MNSNFLQKRIYITTLIFLLLSILFIQSRGLLPFNMDISLIVLPVITLIVILNLEYNDIVLFIKNVISPSKTNLRILLGFFSILMLCCYLAISVLNISLVFSSVLFLLASFLYFLVHTFVVTHSVRTGNAAFLRILIAKFSTRMIELFFVFISIFIIIAAVENRTDFKIILFVVFYAESFYLFELASREVRAFDLDFSDFLNPGDNAMLFLFNILVKLMFLSYIFCSLIPSFNIQYYRQGLFLVTTLGVTFISKYLYSVNSRMKYRLGILALIVFNVIIYGIIKLRELL